MGCGCGGGNSSFKKKLEERKERKASGEKDPQDHSFKHSKSKVISKLELLNIEDKKIILENNDTSIRLITEAEIERIKKRIEKRQNKINVLK